MVVVENQLAEAIPEVIGTFLRLMNEGLDRHEVAHAIGSAVADHVLNLMNEPPTDGDPHAAYFEALESLSADSWQARAAAERA